MSLFALTPLGLGEIIGALLMGILRDKFGYKTSLKILIITTFGAFALLFGTMIHNSFNYLTFIMTFVWGL